MEQVAIQLSWEGCHQVAGWPAELAWASMLMLTGAYCP